MGSPVKIRRCPRNGNWLIISPEARYQPFAAHHFKVHNDDAEGVVCGFIIKLHAIPSLNRKFTNIALGKSMKHKQLTTAISVLLSSSTVLAEITPLETTLVTATRTEQTVSSTLAPSSVFTKADIERLQAKDLGELLQRIPGVSVTSSGSKGSDTDMYLRGSSGDHTLFLIDGQRFNSATKGTTNFQLVEPEQIERIEIVRGARSSIYGSDAIGGVVQIFTKKGNDKPSHFVSTGAGSNNTWQVSAGSKGKTKDIRYSANISHLKSDGFDNVDNNTQPNNNDDDDDGYRNSTASLSLGYDFTDGSKLDVNYFHTQAKIEYDSKNKVPYSEKWIQTTNLTYSSPTIGIWSTQAVLGYSIDDSDSYDDLKPTKHDYFRTSRKSFLWQNDFQISDQQLLTLGLDYYDDKVNSSSEYTDIDGIPVEKRDNIAHFGVYQASFGMVDIQLGLREDDNEDFGKETTGNASIGLQVDDHHKFILSYGEGYKVPTFNDLYWPNLGWSFGNPNLKSESSENYEFELRGDYKVFNWKLNYFQTDISNLIDWAPVNSTPDSPITPSNIDEAEIEGSELTLSMEIAGWQVNASVDYVLSLDSSVNKQLTNRPKKSLNIDIDKNYGRWQIGFGLQAAGKTYGDLENTEVTAGYGLLNARLGYQITDALKAQVKLNNLLDKDYQTRYGYNQDRFNGFVTITYTM